MFMTKRQKLSIDLEEEFGNGLAEGRQEAEFRLQPIIDQQSDQINQLTSRIAELEKLLEQTKN